MGSLHERPQELQMPVTAQDRNRQRVSGKYLKVLAELLYRCDKGNEYVDFNGLTADAQAVYLADALLWLSAEHRMERIKRVHFLDAHAFAEKDDERESVERQARQDVAQFGGRR